MRYFLSLVLLLVGSNVYADWEVILRIQGAPTDAPLPDLGPHILTASQLLAEQTAAAIPAADFYTTEPQTKPTTDITGTTVTLYYPNDPEEQAILTLTTKEPSLATSPGIPAAFSQKLPASRRRPTTVPSQSTWMPIISSPISLPGTTRIPRRSPSHRVWPCWLPG